MKAMIAIVALALGGCASGPCDQACQQRQEAVRAYLANRPPPPPVVYQPMPVPVRTTCTTLGNTTNCTTR